MKKDEAVTILKTANGFAVRSEETMGRNVVAESMVFESFESMAAFLSKHFTGFDK